MSYFRNGFVSLSVLSLTLLVLGCSEQKNEVVVEPKKAPETLMQEDTPPSDEFLNIEKLVKEGIANNDDGKVREGLQLVSSILEKDPNNLSALATRSSIYMALEEPSNALKDLQKRNALKQSGTFKFAECVIKDSTMQLADSTGCYKDAADIFSKEQAEPEKDSNYLIALLYSGDASAPQKIRTLMANTDKEWEKEGLRMYLESYEKYVECKKLSTGPCSIS